MLSVSREQWSCAPATAGTTAKRAAATKDEDFILFDNDSLPTNIPPAAGD